MSPEPPADASLPPTGAVPERLEGPRVVLRPYAPEDAVAVFEAVAESPERLRAWMGWSEQAHRSVEHSRAFCARALADWLLRGALVMGVFGREDGRFLGSLGVYKPDWRRRRFELGYWLRASAEGHGYMREALRVTARTLFDELAAQRVEIRCAASNARSRRTAEGAGFRHEATLRGVGEGPNGTVDDEIVFALLREWY